MSIRSPCTWFRVSVSVCYWGLDVSFCSSLLVACRCMVGCWVGSTTVKFIEPSVQLRICFAPIYLWAVVQHVILSMVLRDVQSPLSRPVHVRPLLLVHLALKSGLQSVNWSFSRRPRFSTIFIACDFIETWDKLLLISLYCLFLFLFLAMGHYLYCARRHLNQGFEL